MENETKFGITNLTKREISDKVMGIVAKEGLFPKIYEEGNRKIEVCVSHVEPIIYGFGMAEPNIFVNMKVSENGKTLSFNQRIELGAYVYRKFARENVPYGKEYFEAMNDKVSGILMKVMNGK